MNQLKGENVIRPTYLKVKNYRALRDVEIPLSKFGCLIGENNTGKSSILQTISLFLSGSKLSSSYYFDPQKPVRIEVSFNDVSEDDFQRLDESHRERIRSIVENGFLRLVRMYGIDGSSSLAYVGKVPTDVRFSNDEIDILVKGKKASREFMEEVILKFPELEGQINSKSSQTFVREKIEDLTKSLPDDQFKETDLPLPTGLDKSIYSMLPEAIYIPAVKDLGDDIKTKEGTPFGRILRILLDQIQDELTAAEELFTELNQKLNPIETEEGEIDDTKRLPQIKEIESTVQRFVQESFRDVKLKIRIPPPEIKTVLSNAQIYADDGVEGLIDTKGDGLRRAVVFSILRTYVELRRKHLEKIKDQENIQDRYLLLFEEPELFLHPNAQLLLFDALSEFSNNHTVVVTTHSPLFFSPEATATFIKLYKCKDIRLSKKPFSCVLAIDLSDMNKKDQFQLICYENNDSAFFASTVILVEGDSDIIVLPHIAKKINAEWNTNRMSIRFARINGKSSIRRYTQFFKHFDVRTPVIADLDLITDDFNQIEPNKELIEMRDILLKRVDEILAEKQESNEVETPLKKVKEDHRSGKFKKLHKAMLEKAKNFNEGFCSDEEAKKAADDFWEYVHKEDRISILENEGGPDFIKLKRDFLAKLREHDVYILERGTIEAYYPPGIEGTDKPTRAQNFCKKYNTKEEILDLCSEHEGYEFNGSNKEFSLIFCNIFETKS